MKRLIIAAVIFCVVGKASAQTTGGGSNRNSNTTSSSSIKTKAGTGKKGKKATAAPLNEGKEYQWKNGQKATPAGQEATPTNGGYASLKKDTALKPVKNKQKR